MDQEQQPEPITNWEYQADDTQGTQDIVPAEVVSWTASEFIAHHKEPSWYAIFGLVTAIVCAATFLMTQEVISAVVVLVVAIAFGAFASRKPRTLPYAVDASGVHVDQKLYPYESFKSFSVIQEGGIRSITLMPLKRFQPPLSLYTDPADEERIIDALAAYLPMEPRQQELIDRLMRHLRF